MPAYEASLSLARLAVFTDAAEVRASSTRALGERHKEDYIPPLIGLLSAPVQSRIAVSRVPKGWIFESVLTTETSNRLQVWRSSKAYLPVMVVATIGVQTGNVYGATVGDMDTSPSTGSARSSNDISRLIGDDVYRAARTANVKKDSIEELNGRVAAVLAGVSGREPTTNASAWWEWWAAYSGVDQPATGTKIVDEFSDQQVYRPVIQTIQWSPSCFQAGTPVWTESGMQPIEQIRVGDRVLAQDVETGELTYKPVLQTSVRAPRQLLTLTAGGEELTCTDGHRFWVAGEAWTKARDLKPKQLLHTARGTIPVESVTEADIDRTYNLVVADFHSYFVGRQAMLVQDLPLPRSTNCVVPGLQPEW
jgi:hypothetical protein